METHIVELFQAIELEDVEGIKRTVDLLKDETLKGDGVNEVTNRLSVAIESEDEDIERVLKLANEVIHECRNWKAGHLVNPLDAMADSTGGNGLNARLTRGNGPFAWWVRRPRKRSVGTLIKILHSLRLILFDFLKRNVCWFQYISRYKLKIFYLRVTLSNVSFRSPVFTAVSFLSANCQLTFRILAFETY